MVEYSKPYTEIDRKKKKEKKKGLHPGLEVANYYGTEDDTLP
jgi:hypothetical protein